MTCENTSPIPAFLETSVRGAYPADTAERILAGYGEARNRPVTLRANTLRASVGEVRAALDAAGIAYEPVSWYGDALVLADGVSVRDVWDLDIYREGKVYLQSLSSMLPPLVLSPAPRAEILDMCSAPGGKASQMAALEPTANILACEMHKVRADKLEFNLERLGARNVRLMRCDARRLDEFFSFDQVLLDAPCTGSGTFRAGDAKAAGRITEALLKKVVKSQAALLDRALTVLKPGGTLLYSTCSVLSEENARAVEAALKPRRHRDCELAPIELDDAFTSGEHALPLIDGGLPGTLTVAPSRPFEGFFLAKIVKAAPQGRKR